MTPPSKHIGVRLEPVHQSASASIVLGRPILNVELMLSVDQATVLATTLVKEILLRAPADELSMIQSMLAPDYPTCRW